MSAIPPAGKEEYPALKKPERRHVGVLRERRDYLLRRVKETPDNAASYHEAEARAIDWALGLVDEKFRDAS